ILDYSIREACERAAKSPSLAGRGFRISTIVTDLIWPAAAERRGYPDGPRSPEKASEPPYRENRVPAALGAVRIRKSAHRHIQEGWDALACGPEAAASTTCPGLTHGPRPGARSPRRGGRDRHWRGAAAAT